MLALEVITEESFATVKWFKDDEEIKITRKRNQRMKLMSKECHHLLLIEKCLPSDTGCYSVSTNTETSSTDVSVAEFPYTFTEKLQDTVIVTEDGKVELNVTVDDESAEVVWLHDGVEMKPEKSR